MSQLTKDDLPPVVAWLCFSGGAYTAAECDNVPYHGDEPLVKLCDAEAQLFSVTALRDMIIQCGEPECRDVVGHAEKLRAVIDGLIAIRRQRDDLLAWKHRHERFARIGAAIERACETLPEGADLHIELEKHAGTVRLYLPDTDASFDDFGGDDFADQIDNAINIAIANAEQNP